METAQGILSVVTANMARAIRVISVQRGHDPRDYTLMAFGGAGPLHAARLARELDIAPRAGAAQSRHPLRHGPAADRPARRFRGDAAAAGERRQQPATRRRLRRPRRAGRALVRAGRHRARRRGSSRAPSTCATTARTTSCGIACPTARSMAHDRRLRAALPRRIASATVSRPTKTRSQFVTLRLEANGVVRKAELKAASRGGPRRLRRHRAPPRCLAGRDQELRRRRRSTPASACGPATASPAPRSSSRWTPRRSCRPA